MSKRGKSFLVLVISLLLLESCVNDIPYNAKVGAPMLYMNALLAPDSTLTATVGRTVHFLEVGQPQRITDAEVIATVDGVQMQMNYDSATQSYRNDYTLQADDEVRLEVHTVAYGSATATQRVSAPVGLSIESVTEQPFVNPGDPVSLAMLSEVDSALLISLCIDDPIDEANYYRLTVDYHGTYLVNYPDGIYAQSMGENYSNSSGYITHETFYPHYLLTESSSRLVTNSESASQLLDGLFYLSSDVSFIFSDEQLRKANGKPVMDFLMLMELPRGSSDDMYNPESGWMDGDAAWDSDFVFPPDTISRATYHYHFALETLSEDYYHYLSTVSAYNLAGGGLVSEPVRIHSNVSTGIGIVGSYSVVAAKDSVMTSLAK